MNAQRVALVTGAAQGLGLAWVKKLADEDYHVFLTARNLQRAEQAAIEAGFATNQVTALQLDVTSESQIQLVAEIIQSQFRRLDVLINNAGYNAKDHPDKEVFASSFELDKLDADELLKSYRINTIGPLLLTKHFRALLKAGETKTVINIGSWLGSVSLKTRGGHYGYSGSKQALNMLNKAAALDMKDEGIASLVVNPGWVATRMGGDKATFQPSESVENMYQQVLLKAHELPVGGFINHDGEEHPL